MDKYVIFVEDFDTRYFVLLFQDINDIQRNMNQPETEYEYQDISHNQNQ